MTDEEIAAERNAKIEKTKQRVLTEIFGEKAAKSNPDIPIVEFRTIDKNWNSGTSWMSQPRFTNPMNNDTRGVGEYNKLIHDNNGVIVTVSDEKPGFAADPIK